MPLDIKGFLLDSDGESPVTLAEMHQMNNVIKRLPHERDATGEEIYTAITAIFGSDFPMWRIKKILDFCTYVLIPKQEPEEGD